MSFDSVPFEHAFAMERAVRTFLAAQGVPTIPCNEFSGRNQQHQRAPTTFMFDVLTRQVERMVLPDLIRFPTFHAVEIKTQGYAPRFGRANVATTGFQRRHWNHYRRYQKDTGKSVEIAFVHLVEDRVVGGNLNDLEPFRSQRVNVCPTHADWFYEYDRLPVWPVSLTELLAVALDYGRSLGSEGYSQKDHQAVIAYRDNVARPNFERHAEKWGTAAPQLSLSNLGA